MNPKYLFIIGVLCCQLQVSAQNKVLQLNLNQTIQMAQENAPQAQISKSRLASAKLQYQQFENNRKPILELTGQLPTYSRITYPVLQDDGTQEFKRNQSLSSNANLSISKPLNTGGTISASTGLRQRIDFFSQADGGNLTSYLASPIYVNFSQPFFGFNSLKWDRKVQDLSIKEAEREYTEQLADIAQQAVVYFFDLHLANLNLESARMDEQNADEMYELAQGRYSVGKIAETDLLQMELKAMQADARVVQSEMDVQESEDNLRFFLQVDANTTFDLLAPESVPEYIINPQIAIQQAAVNRKYKLTQERQLLEAERGVERSKKEAGPEINLIAGFGLSKSDPTLSEAYGWPQEDQESIAIGVNIPIADWGRTKTEREIAQINKEILELTVEQENIDFERVIILKIRQLDLSRTQLNIAEKANDIAIKRFDLTKKRYEVGKVDITDLNLAISEQTNARQSQLQALRTFWANHYDLQRLTLYDFDKGKPLEF